MINDEVNSGIWSYANFLCKFDKSTCLSLTSQPQTLYSRNFVLLSLSNLLMATGFYFLMPTLPIYVVDVLKGTTSEVGYILSIYTLSALGARLVTGFAVDSHGRKLIYLLAFTLFAMLLGVYAVAHTLILLLVVRFVHGLVWGASTTAASTVIVDIVPAHRRGEAIGVYGLSFTLAMAFGPLLALIVLGNNRYTLMFLTAMGCAVAGLMLTGFVRFPEYKKPAINRQFTFRNIIAPKTLPMATVQLLFGITYGGLLSFITLYARQAGMEKPGSFFAVFAAGIAVSRIVSGKVFDLKGPALPVSAGLLSGTAGFFLLGMVATPSGILASAVLVGICMGVTMPTLQAMANNVVESHQRGAANATFITSFDLGIGAGSLLLGIIAKYTGLQFLYMLCGTIVAIAFVIFRVYTLGFYRRKKLPAQ